MPTRYFPIDWIPKWMEPNYSEDSTLRKLYFLGLVYGKNEMKRLLQDQITPGFYNTVYGERIGWVANYNFKTYVPNIVAWTSGTSAIVRVKDSIGSLTYDKINPVYHQSDDVLYIKNLGIRSVSLTASAGVLSLTSTLSGEPIEEDSLLIVENQWGDLLYFGQEDQRFDPVNSNLSVGFEGTFTVHYLSQTRLNAFRNGSNYITIDNEQVSIKPYYFDNTWDEWGKFKSLERKDNESNTSLKAKCQFLTLAKTVEQKVSAALGQAQIFIWNPSASFVYAGSGIVSAHCFTLSSYVYQNEYPQKVDSYWVLSREPSGYVQVFLDMRKVETSAYIVSGSRIVPLTTNLSNASMGSVRVEYKHSIITDSASTLSVTDMTRQPVIGLLAKKVRITNSTKKINEWRWNTDLGVLAGLADFDF